MLQTVLGSTTFSVPTGPLVGGCVVGHSLHLSQCSSVVSSSGSSSFSLVCAHDDNTLVERGPQPRDLEGELGGSQLSASRSMDKGVGEERPPALHRYTCVHVCACAHTHAHTDAHTHAYPHPSFALGERYLVFMSHLRRVVAVMGGEP